MRQIFSFLAVKNLSCRRTDLYQFWGRYWKNRRSRLKLIRPWGTKTLPWIWRGAQPAGPRCLPGGESSSARPGVLGFFHWFQGTARHSPLFTHQCRSLFLPSLGDVWKESTHCLIEGEEQVLSAKIPRNVLGQSVFCWSTELVVCPVQEAVGLLGLASGKQDFLQRTKN